MMNTPKILRAVAFAVKAHDGQIRKFENKPYVLHCIRVAEKVARVTDDEDVICAALLHDVLEDCPNIQPIDIYENFGGYVLHLVKELTDSPKSVGNREHRKRIDTERLAWASAETQTIKCGDIIDNVPSIVEHDKNFAPRFIREKQTLIKVLDRANTELWEEANNLIQESAKKLLLEEVTE